MSHILISPNSSRRLVSIVAMLLWVTTFLCGCTSHNNSKDLGDYSSYLGEYSYNSSISAMVYEDLDGEGLGIQYREVTDFQKLVSKCPLPVCLYFYSGLRTDNSEVTASVEQLAEEYHDRILFVSIDGMQEKDMITNFAIGALPDFVLLNEGAWIASFVSSDRETWTNAELSTWVLANSEAA